MKIQITLYHADRMSQLHRESIEVDDKHWEEMDFLEKEDYCKTAVEKALHWHWREIGEKEF